VVIAVVGGRGSCFPCWRLPIIDIKHLAERFTLFVMLCIGVTFDDSVSIAAQEVHDENNEEADPYLRWKSTAAAVFLACAVKVLYADLQGEAKPSGAEGSAKDTHALAASALRGTLWVWLHLPLCYFIVIIAGIIEQSSSPYLTNRDVFNQQFGVALAFIAVTLAWLQMCHVENPEQPRRASKAVRMVIRHCIAVVILTMPWWGWHSSCEYNLDSPQGCPSAFWFSTVEVSLMVLTGVVEWYLQGVVNANPGGASSIAEAQKEEEASVHCARI